MTAFHPTRKGVDSAGSLEHVAHLLRAEGYDFACRYLSHHTAKDVTFSEIQALHTEGIDVVLVFEDLPGQAFKGFHQGVDDMVYAQILASTMHIPDTVPIHMAVDNDPAGHLDAIQQYFAGCDSVRMERGRGYGGVPVLNMLRRAGWKSAATSWDHGQTTEYATIYQTTQQVSIGGVICDVNVAAGDIGAYLAFTPHPDHPKPPEPTMNLVCVRNLDGRLEMFDIHGPRAVHMWEATPGGERSAWVPLIPEVDGKPFVVIPERPEVTMRPDGRWVVFVTNLAGGRTMVEQAAVNGAWKAPVNL